MDGRQDAVALIVAARAGDDVALDTVLLGLTLDPFARRNALLALVSVGAALSRVVDDLGGDAGDLLQAVALDAAVDALHYPPAGRSKEA